MDAVQVDRPDRREAGQAASSTPSSTSSSRRSSKPGFLQAENNIDDEALTKILTHPNAVIGLGDGGAHVQFHGGYGYITKLLGEWVREKQVMTLEQAVRRLTFELGLDLRPLRPRPAAAGHGGRHRDLRSRPP